MRVLFIDPVSLDGHINFNKIHLQSLLKQPIDLDCIFVEGYRKRLGLQGIDEAYSIPQNIIKTNKGGLAYRWSIYKALRLIKKNVGLSDYDKIIISCYEEISLALSFFPKSYIINHNNLCNLNNSLKKFFYRLVSHRHNHLVLNTTSFNYLKEIGVSNVKQIGHGLVDPYHFEKRRFDNGYSIFTPSLGSTDREFVQTLIDDESFRQYLKGNKIQLIVRGNYIIHDSDNITVMNRHLSFNQYVDLFMNSDCLLICYPLSFKYRVSGVLLEAIANNKKCVIRNSPDFKEYEPIFGKEAFYSNSKDLQNAIGKVLDDDYSMCLTENDIQNLSPDYSFLNGGEF